MGLPQRAQPPLQLSLPLRLPADYYDWIYASQQREIIAYTPLQETSWHVLNRSVAREKLSRWTDQPDVFITPNEFFRWRLIKNVAALNALYIDLDCHQGEDIGRCVEHALSALEFARIPQPNAIIYTGRGAHIYWLLERTHGAALPRWQACQRRLIEITGADRMCADATRVLRVVGSVNTKAANAIVRAEPISNARYQFDWLHDQIMPQARAEIRDLRAVRAKRGDRLPGYAAGSIYQRWYLVYRDLHSIVQHNWFGGQVPEGNRDTILFHMANALSWFTISEALENEIVMVAQEITPSLSRKDALSYCTSVVNRARKTALDPDGGEHRYKYKRETLYGQLENLIPKDLLPRLRAIIPDELARDRQREANRRCDTRRRQEAGAISRTEYLDAAATKRARIKALRDSGMTIRAIADSTGIPPSTVSACLKKSAGVHS